MINILLLQNLKIKNFAARLAQANVVTKTDFDNKPINFNKKINSNKIKDVLVENELKNLQTFDSIYFRGKSHFENDGTQNTFKKVSNTSDHILPWKSNV